MNPSTDIPLPASNGSASSQAQSRWAAKNGASTMTRGGAGDGKRSGGGLRPPQEAVKTWAFDSVGNRKYALQIRRASNGNPCIKVVEGVPQPDGTFRKFELTFWSEDWPRLFEAVDALRAFVQEQNIKTPDGHKFDPNKKSWPRRKRSA